MPEKRKKNIIMLRVEDEFMLRVREQAKKFGLPITAFVKYAVVEKINKLEEK